MGEGESILILGEGRIAQAVLYYLKKYPWLERIEFYSSDKRVEKYSLIISCLPGKEAPLGLELALKFRKNLLDVSDLDPPFYSKRKRDIEKRGIFVVPGCGFCPGLVNFIIGREIYLEPKIDNVFIKVGSLSKESFFFPFLWCFEDLILEHRLPSFQIISGRKIKLSPFSGYKKEKLLGISAESYFSVSGFENILEKKRFLNFHFRVIRPVGFRDFFYFLENYGFLNKENFEYTRKVVEKVKKDNYTIAIIELRRGRRKIVWEIVSFSKKESLLNSMQKITAIVPASLYRIIFMKKIPLKGLIFMEELAKNEILFEQMWENIKEKGISLERRTGKSC